MESYVADFTLRRESLQRVALSRVCISTKQVMRAKRDHQAKEMKVG